MERLTKRATDGQAIMDCEKCKADWTGMEAKRAIEILDPEHREHYDSIEPVNEACRMGMEALRELEAYKKAVSMMAQYIVEVGLVDVHLCDEIPDDIHQKHQPLNDGNYTNGPCIECVAEYYLRKAHEA